MFSVRSVVLWPDRKCSADSAGPAVPPHGSVRAEPQAASVGIQWEAVPSTEAGAVSTSLGSVWVKATQPGTQATKRGIKVHDVLLQADGCHVAASTVEDVRGLLACRAPGPLLLVLGSVVEAKGSKGSPPSPPLSMSSPRIKGAKVGRGKLLESEVAAAHGWIPERLFFYSTAVYALWVQLNDGKPIRFFFFWKLEDTAVIRFKVVGYTAAKYFSPSVYLSSLM